MDDQKIQDLRTQVLHDLKEFTPSTWYKGCLYNSNLHGSLSFRDFKLWEHIMRRDLESPKMSLREIAAIYILQVIGLAGMCDEHEPASETPSLKEDHLINLQELFDDYVERYLSPDEARALKASESANEPTSSRNKQKQAKTKNKIERNLAWQTKMETMAEKLIKDGKRAQATKGKLALELAKEHGEKENIAEKAATIERNTRKTW